MAGLDYVSFVAVWVWPLLSAILGAFLTVYLLYKLQKPKLVVTVAADKYDEQFDRHYVHLKVRNAAKGFLGGGTAANCRGKITLADGRSFITKWATKANPLRTEILSQEGKVVAINIVEPAYIDQAKHEYLRPGDEKSLDVAVRFKNDTSCYIHTPENFQDVNQKPEGNRLGTGVHTFSVVFEFDGGKSKDFHFRIVNNAGDSPGLMGLES